MSNCCVVTVRRKLLHRWSDILALLDLPGPATSSIPSSSASFSCSGTFISPLKLPARRCQRGCCDNLTYRQHCLLESTMCMDWNRKVLFLHFRWKLTSLFHEFYQSAIHFYLFSFHNTLREMSNTWSPRLSVIPTPHPSLPSFFGLRPSFLLSAEYQWQHGVVKCEL